jgi:hypothetical protein
VAIVATGRDEISPVRCGEATSRTGIAGNRNKDLARAIETPKYRTSRPTLLTESLNPKKFTLQGWGLTPLRRKFFPD